MPDQLWDADMVCQKVLPGTSRLIYIYFFWVYSSASHKECEGALQWSTPCSLGMTQKWKFILLYSSHCQLLSDSIPSRLQTSKRWSPHIFCCISSTCPWGSFRLCFWFLKWGLLHPSVMYPRFSSQPTWDDYVVTNISCDPIHFAASWWSGPCSLQVMSSTWPPEMKGCRSGSHNWICFSPADERKSPH